MSCCIGIDLGCTHCLVGTWLNGEVVIIPNTYGNRTTPSFIYLGSSVPEFGDSARSLAPVYANSTVFETKRLIGLPFSSVMVQKYNEYWPFEVVADSEGRPAINICDGDGRQHVYSVRQLIRMLLSHMKTMAEAFIGQPVAHAVITVPAHFNYHQRQEVLLAAAECSLDVARIVNEPTAAAIAGCIKNPPVDETKVVVYDIGGGTLDVTLFVFDDGIEEVVATAGDNSLGGSDLDTELVKHFVGLFNSRHGVEMQRSPKAMSRLRVACERARRQLSTELESRIEIDKLYNEINFDELITRAKFENLNAQVFRRCMFPVHKVLEDSRCASAEISRVVLVGGCSRTPKIRELLANEFSSEKLCFASNPEETIVYGATVLAEILSGNQHERLDDFLLLDVTGFSLGVETGCVTGVMTPIIRRNCTVPAKKSQTFTTTRNNQEMIEVRVYQGERALARDNLLLEVIRVEGIPPLPSGVPQFDVIIDIDANEVIIVVVEYRTGPQDTIRITRVNMNNDLQSRRQPGTEIEVMLPDSDATPPPSPQQNPMTSAHTASSAPAGAEPEPIHRAPPTPPRSSTQSHTSPQHTQPPSSSSPSSRPVPSAPPPPPTPSFFTPSSTDLSCPQIEWADVSLDAVIALGAFSTVHKASWRGSTVAVKVIRTPLSASDMSFERELNILAALRHPRLLSLMGVSRDIPQELGSAGLVMEFMQNGTIFSALRLQSTSPLTDVERLHIAVDVADGMRFLHHSNIIHRDLKSANVLLDAKGQAKICDFGLSAMKDTAISHVTGVTGTAAWTAPEALSGGRVRSSCDVYSFGVILWELVTGNIPWEGMSTVQVICQVAAKNARLTVPSPVEVSNLCSAEVCSMIRRCFSAEDTEGEGWLSRRPTFDALHTVLHRRLVAEQQSGCDASNILSRAQDCMICPISYEIMSDPVICSDGHSYERAFIQEWLRTSSVSPMTGAVLPNDTLIPNHSLKSLIVSLTSSESS